jgi:hypothetical protein
METSTFESNLAAGSASRDDTQDSQGNDNQGRQQTESQQG